MTPTSQQLQKWLTAKEDEHLEFKEAKANFHFRYHVTGKPRPLDRDTAKVVLLQFIEEHRRRGSTLADMLSEFPSVSLDQLKGLLRELKGEGKVHGVGRTRSGRWYPGTTST